MKEMQLDYHGNNIMNPTPIYISKKITKKISGSKKYIPKLCNIVFESIDVFYNSIWGRCCHICNISDKKKSIWQHMSTHFKFYTKDIKTIKTIIDTF